MLRYFHCTTANSVRSWCYTTKPGLWGYCDCYGLDDTGWKWEVGEWGECPVTCGGGLRARDVKCVNSTTGATIATEKCGTPSLSAESCNTQDCGEGCGLPLEDRKPCAGYYDDPWHKYSLQSARKALCYEYGCCYASEDDDNAKGARCYTSAVAQADTSGGCVHPGRNPSTLTSAHLNVS